MRLIGVTGTDTGVGKTRVTAGIARAMRSRGLRVAALKPVASGVPPGEIAEDAVELALGAGHEPRVFAAFEAPVSPHRAAALEGRSVSRRALSAWIRSFDAELVLVEGAGGLRSPLGQDEQGWFFLDDLGLDAMVAVAPNRLGVLSATGLLVASLEGRIPLEGLFLNEGVGEPDDPSRPYNESDLRRLASLARPPVSLVVVPNGNIAAVATAVADWVSGLR